MAKRFLDDFRIGERSETGTITLTEDEVIAFARQFDPQPFHLDHDAAARSVFGGLVASGWHTAAITMRLLVDHALFGENDAPGLGVDKLRWLKPVKPGDTLKVEIEVIGIEPSERKPDRGTLKTRITTRRLQDGAAVMSYVSAAWVPRRVG